MRRRRGPQPDRETAWRTLASRRGGTIVTDRRKRVKSVSFPAGVWTIVLDNYTQSHGNSSQTYTRVRAICFGKDEFRLRMGRRTFLSGLADWFGRKRVHAGHPEIEAKWIVKSNSDGRAQSLLMLPAVVHGLHTVRSASVRFEPCRGRRAVPGTHAVTIAMSGSVSEAARIEGALDLCAAMVDHLVRMGCARREPVQAGQQ